MAFRLNSKYLNATFKFISVIRAIEAMVGIRQATGQRNRIRWVVIVVGKPLQLRCRDMVQGCFVNQVSDVNTLY